MSAIDDLVTELSRLPTIGRKSAMRLTYHLLKQPPEQSKRLAHALSTLSERVRQCDRCHNLTEFALCEICTDSRRDPPPCFASPPSPPPAACACSPSPS